MSILLLYKIIELFFIMLFGCIIVRLKVLKADDGIVLSKLSLYVLTPCVIISALQVTVTPAIKQGLLLSFAVAMVVQILLIGMGYLAGIVFHANEVEKASLAYPNTANLIIPLVIASIGKEWVIYTSAFLSIQAIFLWTHCKSMFSTEEKIDWRTIVLNINILATIVGILMFVANVKLPILINNAISSLGTMIGPVSMLITGMLIAKTNPKQLFSHKRIYFISILRMVLCPGVLFVLLKWSQLSLLVPNGQKVLLIILLAAAAPAASTVMQFAQVYNKNAEYANAINIMTTLLCIITLPMFMVLYNLSSQ